MATPFNSPADFRIGNSAEWVDAGHASSTVIEVLQFLYGYPLDDIALNYIQSLRPSCWRISTDGALKSDARGWRVTVHMSGDGPFARILSIEQEVHVGLRGGFEHGHALDCARKAREKA